MMHPDATSSLFHIWPSFFPRRGQKRSKESSKIKDNKQKTQKHFSVDNVSSIECKSQSLDEISKHVVYPVISHKSPTSVSTRESRSVAENLISGSDIVECKIVNTRYYEKKKTSSSLTHTKVKQENLTHDDNTSANNPADLPIVTKIPIGGKEFIASVLADTSEDNEYGIEKDKEGSAVASSEEIVRDKIIQLSNDHTYFEFKSPKRKVILKITKVPDKPSDRIKTLEELLDILTRESLLSEEARSIIEGFVDLPNGLVKNRSQNLTTRPHMRYSISVEKFAATIYFHAPRAYEFVCKIFLLPEPFLLREIVKVWNYRPGFTREALSVLKKGFRKAPYTTRLCSLMIINVKIKEQCDFDMINKVDIGYVDFGGGQQHTDSDELGLATDALLLVAVGLVANWKLPFGYFLNKNLHGEFLRTLVTEAIIALEECHLEVQTLVCDGRHEYLTLASDLGCKIKVKSYRDIESSFPHPTSIERKVIFISDINYSLKLLQNLLSDKGSLQSTTYGRIEWKYLKWLLDGEPTLNAMEVGYQSNPEFYRQKMKIQLGSHSLGNSLGKTLELHCQTFLEKFQGYFSTVDFASDIDRAYDTLNSRNPVAPGERSPMFQYTVEEQKESLTFVGKRIMGLECVSGKKVVDEGRQLSVLTIASSLKGVCQLASDLVNKNVVRYLCTNRLSLQHAEMILSCLQRRGNWQGPPSALQFQSAFRNLVGSACIELKINSLFTNDFEGEDVTISQGSIFNHRNPYDQHKTYNFFIHNSCLLDYGTEVLYRAKCILHDVANKLTCSECIEMLLNNDHYKNVFVHSKVLGFIDFIPSNYVVKLIKFCGQSTLKWPMMPLHSWQFEKCVCSVFEEFCQLNQHLGINESSLSHFIEEPFHIICLTKVLIRTTLSLACQRSKQLPSFPILS